MTFGFGFCSDLYGVGFGSIRVSCTFNQSISLFQAARPIGNRALKFFCLSLSAGVLKIAGALGPSPVGIRTWLTPLHIFFKFWVRVRFLTKRGFWFWPFLLGWGSSLYVSNNARCCSIRTVFLLIPTGVFSPSLRQSASVMDTADRLYGTSFIIRPEWCVVGSHGVDATDISCQRDLMMMMTMMMCPVPRCLKRTRSSDFLCLSGSACTSMQTAIPFCPSPSVSVSVDHAAVYCV